MIYAKILFLFNILRTNGQKFTKFYKCIHIDNIYVGIVTHHFSHFCTRVMAFDLLQNFVPLNILRTNGQILIKLYITIYTDKIYFGIVSCHFSHICTSVMTLDLCQYFISVQYLENKWIEFH